MDEESEQPRLKIMGGFIRAWFPRFCFYFTVAMFAFMISLFASPYVPAFERLFGAALTGGIKPITLHLLALGSFALSLSAEIIFADHKQSRLNYFWRIVIIYAIDMAICSLFALISAWFPVTDIKSWASLALFVTIIHIVWTGAIVVKTKLRDRKDNHLLEEYKKANGRRSA